MSFFETGLLRACNTVTSNRLRVAVSKAGRGPSAAGGARLAKKFERVLKDYRGQPGALITLLQEAQAVYGYLPTPVIRRIARASGRSPAQVYGVASFYTQFRLAPAGRSTIRVCHGTACHVAGADRIEEAINFALGIQVGETTADGEYSLQRVACLGCCSLAPVIMIDEKAYGRLTPRKVEQLFAPYLEKAQKPGKPRKS